ncbi:MAG TPA: alpha/beta hydrolase [Solimonas sp.]|nr:alpha/beta hydrolase [Solimonas sp.]
MQDLEHRYANINGIRLHYVCAGDPTAPLMLFVHGFPEFWMAWEGQLAEFARTHFVVAPDLRGFNLSDKPPLVADYHPRKVVEDLRQLIQYLGRKRAIVVAHDWGGAVCWNLAAWHPEAIERLVIINAPHPMTYARELSHNPAQQAASSYVLLFLQDKAERVMSDNNYARLLGMLDGWLKSAKPPSTETIAAYREAWAQPGAMTASLNYYRVSPLHPPSAASPGAAKLNLSAEMFTVRVPTLVIWGEQDPALLVGLLDGLEQYVPDLRIERIAEGTHFVAHECPERVNGLIRDFLES